MCVETVLGIVCKSGGEGEKYWGEEGAVHLSGQRNGLKVWGFWCRVILVECCSWVVNQDSVLYQNPLENGSAQRGTWVWTARARTWQPGSPLLHITRKIYFFSRLPAKVAFNTINSPRFYCSSNPSQPNHSSLLRANRCLLIYLNKGN